ncbi:hypothetical protein PINS_up022487 [Pythium insidiosum]|nr:hypothetical protein PINS_up022487 [Pythium insidiosum]
MPIALQPPPIPPQPRACSQSWRRDILQPPVRELPDGVALPASTQIGSIKLWRTLITTLPEWIAHPTLGYLARGGVVKAGGSPFCGLFNAARSKNASEWDGNNNNNSESWSWLLMPGNEDAAGRS